MTTTLARAVERFLLPNACVACGHAVERHRPDALVCGVCMARLRPLASGGCPRCRQPLPPVGPCRFCADWPSGLVRVNSAVWLNPTARALVHHFKYSSYPAVGEHLAAVMARYLPRPGEGAVVPVPLGSRRLRERGYNQAAVLAGHLASAWRLPLLEHALQRVRETGTQTALTPAERAENMQGAFVASGARGSGAGRRSLESGAPSPPLSISPSAEGKGRAVILIDDVLTTGATLGAATVALQVAGWGSATAVTFARALPFEMRATAPERPQRH